jgi:hydrogenase expression/formation protein HypD
VSKRTQHSSDAEQLFRKIDSLVRRPVSLMEVCGTHTMAIGRFGLRARMPADLRLISGPGCPVCVTSCEQIDQAIAMSREPGVTVMSFGDMMRVPGSESTLDRERAGGKDVRIVYSSFDALQFASKNTNKTVVLIGIGFETTSPTVAATLVRAAAQGVRNLFVLPAFKLVPPAMEALAAADDSCIDGFLCPGHVSAVIGCEPYRMLADDLRVPCVIAGFEALDILEGVAMLLEQIDSGRSEVEVAYRRAVPWEGNPAALALMERVFRRCDARWRGIGVIPGSGLELSEEFAAFDARIRVPVQVALAADLPDGCACGAVMQGRLVPTECPLFGAECVPAHPIGPCMISSEGACAAYIRFGSER